MPVTRPYPSCMSSCRKKSLAASLIAFSGVTRVRFTAAPRGGKWREEAGSLSPQTELRVCRSQAGSTVSEGKTGASIPSPQHISLRILLMSAGTHAPSTHVEVRGSFSGASSLLPPLHGSGIRARLPGCGPAPQLEPICQPPRIFGLHSPGWHGTHSPPAP